MMKLTNARGRRRHAPRLPCDVTIQITAEEILEDLRYSGRSTVQSLAADGRSA